jgi:hypothetical protein
MVNEHHSVEAIGLLGSPKRHQISRSVLSPLHLAVYNSGILSLAVNMVNLEFVRLCLNKIDQSYFSDKPRVCDGRVEDVVDINRKKLQEALVSSRSYRVCGVIGCSPCISTTSKPAICKVIDNPLVRVFLRSHEYQTKDH